MKRFRIFSSLFNSQRVGTPIENELTGLAELCSHGKSKSAAAVMSPCHLGIK